jgi:hypothetical protein
MCIYCGTQYHRLIYENHFGPIPVDADGRRYEIHHIDGNHNNNSLDNLQCVSIKEHYQIHLKQGDLKACLIMSKRMKLAPEEKSRLAKISNTGERNPSFGTIWITDGNTNKKIKTESSIPAGWRKGRSFDHDFASRFTERSKVGKYNPRYNHTKYHFKNTVTGEEVLSTPGDFAVAYGINIKRVRGLFRKNVDSVKDWIIIF